MLKQNLIRYGDMWNENSTYSLPEAFNDCVAPSIWEDLFSNISVELHSDVRILYSWRNGQKSKFESEYFIEFVPGFTFLPIDAALNKWKFYSTHLRDVEHLFPILAATSIYSNQIMAISSNDGGLYYLNLDVWQDETLESPNLTYFVRNAIHCFNEGLFQFDGRTIVDLR